MAKKSVRKNQKSSFNSRSSKSKLVSLVTVLLIAAVGSYFLVFSKAAEPDACTNSNMKVFQSGPCVPIIKNMVNIASSGNVTDTNNAGYDGTLNQGLINLSNFGIFNVCGGYVPTSGVTPCVYNALKDFVNAKLNPPPPVTTTPPPPSQPPTPPDSPTPCREQNLHTDSTGSCVALLNAMVTNTYTKCYPGKAGLSGATFTQDTNTYIAWGVAAGNFGDEARSSVYNGYVTPRLWDIILYMNGYYSGGKACLGTTSAPSSAPKPTGGSQPGTITPTQTAAPKAQPGVTAIDTNGQIIQCVTAQLRKGSSNDCVKQLNFFLLSLGESGISATDPKFGDGTHNALIHLVNQTSTLNGIPQGSYNDVVTDKIWIAVKLAAENKFKVESTAQAKAVKEAAAATKAAEDAAAKAAADQARNNLLTTFAKLEEGRPGWINENYATLSLPSTIHVNSNKSNGDLSPISSGYFDASSAGKNTTCPVLVYKSLTKDFNWWTYARYMDEDAGYGNFVSGRCQKWSDGSKISAFDLKLREGPASKALSGARASKFAKDGSYGGL